MISRIREFLRHAFKVAMCLAYPEWDPKCKSLRECVTLAYDVCWVRANWRVVNPWLSGLSVLLMVIQFILWL